MIAGKKEKRKKRKT